MLDHNNLVQIIRLCPNVKCVFKHDINEQVNCYPILLKLYRQGYLRNLEKVSAPKLKTGRYSARENSDRMKDYVRLMLELKESVKQLYVPYSSPIKWIIIIGRIKTIERNLSWRGLAASTSQSLVKSGVMNILS